MNYFFKCLCIVQFVASFSSISRADLPLSCDSKFKSKISPYVLKLEKKGPSKLISKIKASSKEALIDYHLSYGQNIRNEWIYGHKPDRKLIDLYRSAGVNHPDSMSQDLIEGIWVRGKRERCKQILRDHDDVTTAPGQIEDLTDMPKPVPIETK